MNESHTQTQTQALAMNQSVGSSASSDNLQEPWWSVAFDYVRKVSEVWVMITAVGASSLFLLCLLPRAYRFCRECDRKRFANEILLAQARHPIAAKFSDVFLPSGRGFRGARGDPADIAALVAELTLLLSRGVDTCEGLVDHVAVATEPVVCLRSTSLAAGSLTPALLTSLQQSVGYDEMPCYKPR